IGNGRTGHQRPGSNFRLEAPCIDLGRQTMKNGLPTPGSRRQTAAVPDVPTRTHSGRFTELDPDKLRGGYYTSVEIADWLCSWAIRSKSDRVLEPSCGDGVFLAQAASRLRALGADKR